MHAPPGLIPIDHLLLAYRHGIFPMAECREDPEVYWVEPRERAIIPLDGFSPSRSLAKILRQDRFAVTLDRDFDAVVAACAAPRDATNDQSWINSTIARSYGALHRAGHAHSIECWRGDDLVGGLYGVSFDRVFCGESMFSRADNASKVALCWLVALLKRAGYRLLDCQFMTDHLRRLGAIEISQDQYLERLAAAAGTPEQSLSEAYRAFAAEAPDEPLARLASSPGKRILQSLTQTS